MEGRGWGRVILNRDRLGKGKRGDIIFTGEPLFKLSDDWMC